jgi:hypothetical protein
MAGFGRLFFTGYGYGLQFDLAGSALFYFTGIVIIMSLLDINTANHYFFRHISPTSLIQSRLLLINMLPGTKKMNEKLLQPNDCIYLQPNSCY